MRKDLGKSLEDWGRRRRLDTEMSAKVEMRLVPKIYIQRTTTPMEQIELHLLNDFLQH